MRLPTGLSSRFDGTRDVGQRLADGVVTELEARALERRRDGPLPAEEALLARTRPAAVFSAKPGTISGVGRFSVRPIAVVNSEFVTGAGPVKFTGPDTSS